MMIEVERQRANGEPRETSIYGPVDVLPVPGMNLVMDEGDDAPISVVIAAVVNIMQGTAKVHVRDADRLTVSNFDPIAMAEEIERQRSGSGIVQARVGGAR